MRLACINDNGEVSELQVAMQQQPYTVRGLLADGLAHCQRTLPDSFEFLQAERAIREVLRTFQCDQDRYAKGYVLSRTLDHRTQKTPRADLIRLALHRGGPLAFLGVFYATLDAHRNPRNREILEILLHRVTDESKLQLIVRSGTFPCNPSISTWLLRILEKLRPSAQHLACILRCLGTSNVPQLVFRRVWIPSLSWDVNGEIAESPARLVPFVADEQKYTEALRDLEYVGFVEVLATTINLNARIAEFLQLHLEKPIWIAEAVKLLAHVFPKHRSLQSSYVGQCETLHPSLESVYAYLAKIPIKSFTLHGSCLVQFVEVCLSASYFRDRPWKVKTLSIADEAVDSMEETTDAALCRARLDVRRSFVAYLYQETRQQAIAFPSGDHRSHAFSSDLSILQARECVSLHSLASALEHLAAFDPSWHGSISTLGILQNREVILMRTKILRFAGRFEEAYTLLEDLPRDSRTLSLLGALLCEMEKYDEAIQILDIQLREKPIPMKIGLANAYLLKYVHGSQGGLDWRSLQVARGMFQELLRSVVPTSYFEKVYLLSALLGVAMVNHMEGLVDSALQAWQEALAVSQQYLSPGYTDMVIYYSTSDLEAQRGDTIRSDILESQARNLFARTGRQYHFTGLGSIWVDTIGKSYIARGRAPIVPLQNRV